MRVIDSIQTRPDRAVEALKSVLDHTSAIKLRKIETESANLDRNAGIVAHVDVYGHSHVLICKVVSGDDPWSIREMLAELCDRHSESDQNVTHVCIAHRFSAETLAICREHNAGLIDMEGNARLELGEFFIARQSLQQRGMQQKPSLRTVNQSSRKDRVHDRAEIPVDHGIAASVA